MEPLHTTAAQALRVLLDAQPTTAAKVAFVWTMAAGPALARATETEWRDDGVLIVRARTDAWRRELRRARPVLTARVKEMSGAGVVKQIVIE
jgi:predicted nucleic acid-binding Zn ribbon protein